MVNSKIIHCSANQVLVNWVIEESAKPGQDFNSCERVAQRGSFKCCETKPFLTSSLLKSEKGRVLRYHHSLEYTRRNYGHTFTTLALTELHRSLESIDQIIYRYGIESGRVIDAYLIQ